MLLSAIESRDAFEKQSGETSPCWRMAARSCCKPGAGSPTRTGPPLKQTYAVPLSKQPVFEQDAVPRRDLELQQDLDSAGKSDSFFARFGRGVVVGALVMYKGGISPLLPSFCKFYPTCSVYAMEAVERHGVRRGVWLAVKRVLRCRPFAPGGHDPVPDA